jgi:hypothetical protein
MKKRVLSLSVPVLLAALFAGCDNLTTEIPWPAGEIIDQNLAGMDTLTQPEESGTVRLERATDPSVLPSVRSHAALHNPCTVYKYYSSLGFNYNLDLDPASPVIWPGSIIDGNSVLAGAYSEISLERRRIRMDIFTRSQSFQKSIETPDSGSARAFLDETMTAGTLGQTEPETMCRLENIYSPRQLEIALGSHFMMTRLLGTEGTDTFGFGATDVASRKLMLFIKVYCTMAAAKPAMPSMFFGHSVTWEQIESALSGKVSPVYVSAVKYGTINMFYVESPYDQDRLNAALNYAIDGIYIGDPQIITEYGNVLDQSRIRMLGAAGDGSISFGDIAGMQGLQAALANVKGTGTPSGIVPVFYQLNYLKDFNVARIVLDGIYYKRECDELPIRLSVRGRIDETREFIREYDVGYFSHINLYTAPSYKVGKTLYPFIRWAENGGNATIPEEKKNPTIATQFTGDCTVNAVYQETAPTATPTTTPGGTSPFTPAPTNTPTNTPTKTPTNTPTNSPTSTPTKTKTPTPTNSPTPTPEPLYTVSVTHLTPEGNSATDTFANKKSTDSISITTPSSVTFGVPPNGQTIYFRYWQSTNCTVANVNSASSSVSNFTGNATVYPYYQ